MLAAVCFDSLQTGLFFFFPPRPLFPIFSGPPPSAPAFSPVLDKERDSAIRGIRWRLRLAQPIQASPEQPTCHGRHSTGARVMTSLKARRRLAGGRLRRAGEQCADGRRRIARIFVGASRAGSDKSRYAWFQGAVRCYLRTGLFWPPRVPGTYRRNCGRGGPDEDIRLPVQRPVSLSRSLCPPREKEVP